ncbi:MAG: isoaspartyl peptidase/L-asparaginase family protein [Acidimicrobiales bacterium]|jgi:isoaspartyl peptidase/L-asparaginase-like protein (Ntn-hydrolase superfamily)
MSGDVFMDSGALGTPAVVIHGGAGDFVRPRSEQDLGRLSQGLSDALGAAWEVLSAGGHALDAVIEAVARMEASGIFNCGRGAVATARGTVETDAAVMDGASGSFGAICAATWPESPVRAARAVMALGGPSNGPVLLAGAGADRFSEDAGLSRMDPAHLCGEGVRPISRGGTVGAVAVDLGGHLAAATSTGGRLGKLPGRVGDSPIAGAGTWADDASVAVSATGEGESFLVAGFAHRVDWCVTAGAPLQAALRDALGAVSARGGHGGAVVLAPDGSFAVGFDTTAMARAWQGRKGPTVPPPRRDGMNGAPRPR